MLQSDVGFIALWLVLHAIFDNLVAKRIFSRDGKGRWFCIHGTSGGFSVTSNGHGASSDPSVHAAAAAAGNACVSILSAADAIGMLLIAHAVRLAERDSWKPPSIPSHPLPLCGRGRIASARFSQGQPATGGCRQYPAAAHDRRRRIERHAADLHCGRNTHVPFLPLTDRNTVPRTAIIGALNRNISTLNRHIGTLNRILDTLNTIILTLEGIGHSVLAQRCPTLGISSHRAAALGATPCYAERYPRVAESRIPPLMRVR